MNLIHLLNAVEEIDPELADRVSPRRSIIKNIAGFGSKITVASLPFALAALLQKAYGATTLPADIADLFNMALTLEYLESGFYTKGVNSPNLIPPADLPAIQQIIMDENHHITFLQNLLGSQARPSPVFDFTGGGGTGHGQFSDEFTFYPKFLSVAQALEDIGVRAYQGVFPSLLGQQTMLSAAFNIHSVEARHSAHIHQLMYKIHSLTTPWIVTADGNNNGLGNTEFYAVYADEENTVQLGVGNLNESAFDEPMQPTNVKQLLNNLFITSPKLA